MKDKFDSFCSNYDREYYYELYTQYGYALTISGSLNENIREFCESLDGMSLRIYSRDIIKIASTPCITENMLETLLYRLNKYDRSVYLSDKLNKNIISSKSSLYISNIYLNMKSLFSRYGLYFSASIKHIILKRKIYTYGMPDVISKMENKVYISTSYYVNNRKYTFHDVIFDGLYDKTLVRLENDILNFIRYKKVEIIEQGRKDVVLGSGRPAILFHEICGHLFEASKRKSPFYMEREKQHIISPKLTVIDDLFHIAPKEIHDDEGNLKSKVNILKDGKVENFLTDRYTALQASGFQLTGNCRRESYLNIPEPRMYCTYVEKGYDSVGEIFNSITDGIYIKSLGESYVNHSNGDFESLIEEGYLITKGRLCEPIYGVKIRDNVMSVLKNIEYISDDLVIESCNCNSNSGLIYVECGSPTMSIRNLNLTY